jgi:hypothetical protein
MGRTACTEPQCLYSRAIPLLPLRAVRPVQSLSACTRVHVTFTLPNNASRWQIRCNLAFKGLNNILVRMPTDNIELVIKGVEGIIILKVTL